MANRTIESSPRLYARVGGALYLVLIVLGVFAEISVRGRILVAGNAAATAANLSAMEPLWRLGILSEVLSLLFATALAMIYFVLLKPVSRELNLLATFLRLVAIAVQTVAVVNLVAALFPLGSAPYLAAFTAVQRKALASLAIRTYGQGFTLGLLLFGCCFLAHGYLIFRSGFLPRVLGLLIEVAGLSYLSYTGAVLLAPAVADRLFPGIVLPAFVAEASLCLWLLFRGVDAERWKQVHAEAARREAAAVGS